MSAVAIAGAVLVVLFLARERRLARRLRRLQRERRVLSEAEAAGFLRPYRGAVEASPQRPPVEFKYTNGGTAHE